MPVCLTCGATEPKSTGQFAAWTTRLDMLDVRFCSDACAALSTELGAEASRYAAYLRDHGRIPTDHLGPERYQLPDRVDPTLGGCPHTPHNQYPRRVCPDCHTIPTPLPFPLLKEPAL